MFPILTGALEVKQDDALGDGAGALQAKLAPRLYTNAYAQGNPTANSEENALANNPRTSGVFGNASDSVASTPGGQLPGGWVRGPGKFQLITLFEFTLTQGWQNPASNLCLFPRLRYMKTSPLRLIQ